MTVKSVGLLEQAKKVAADWRELTDKAEAESRDLTPTELDQIKAYRKQSGEYMEQYETAKADEKLLSKMAEQFAHVGTDAVEANEASKGWGGDIRNLGRKTPGQLFTESKQLKAALDPFRSTNGSVHIPDRSNFKMDPVRMKSLFTGLSDTSAGAFVTTDRSNIVESLGRRPLTIRDIVSVRRTNSDTVDFVRETAHTNNAAVVAEATSSAAPVTGASGGAALTLNAGGGYKPEGDWGWEVVSTTVKTIAEYAPATRRALADVSQLEGIIRDELVADLKEKEEDQILAGNGTGQNFTGILSTSGIQTGAATTTNDKTWFASFRTAMRLLKVTGRSNPTAVVVNPVQAEKIDTSADSQLRFYGNGPFGLGPTTLWGLPVVESQAMTAGTALIGDFSKAILWDREDAVITTTDSHADWFVRNLIAILAEERLAFGVTRPSAFYTLTGL